jgi:phospholipid/cholesterol/gamma-HCH transport system ATP-binding protein
VIFDGPPSQLDRCDDRRVIQFVRGEAGERLNAAGLEPIGAAG